MTSSADARIGRRCVLGLAASVSIAPGLARAGSGGSETPLRFGLTPVFLTSDLELLGRLQLYLEHRTGQSVILVTRRTYQEITTLLTSGQLDAAWICGYPFVTHRAELRLVAVPLWRAAPLYQSYVIVDRDRSARDFVDLRGDIHAFSDPDSNSGFLSTIALLARQGTRPDGFFARSFFTYGHRNVIRAVASGLASSGSVDGYVYEVVAELEPALTARTRVLRRSEWLGFPPIAAPRVPVDERRLSSLTTALLEMNSVPEGQAVLRMLRLDGFAAGEPALFDTIAANVALVAQAG